MRTNMTSTAVSVPVAHDARARRISRSIELGGACHRLDLSTGMSRGASICWTHSFTGVVRILKSANIVVPAVLVPKYTAVPGTESKPRAVVPARSRPQVNPRR